MASPPSSLPSAKSYTCREQATLTDWQGNILPRAYIDHLGVGCTVRVVVEQGDVQEGKDGKASECIYVDIVKLDDNKDGTKPLTGIVQDTYRTYNGSGARESGGYVGLVSGHEISFEKKHINEIPLVGWQPEWYLEATKDLKPVGEHVGMTGWR